MPRKHYHEAKPDKLTLVAAGRDVLRVVSVEEGTGYDEELGPVIEEVDDLSQRLGEVWTDKLPAYQAMDYDYRTVVHDEEYVSDEGIHTNQAECLWSLIQPWLAKFRGFLQSLNRTGAPTLGLIDCIAVNVYYRRARA